MKTNVVSIAVARRALGVPVGGGTQKPLPPGAHQKRVVSELEENFGSRWLALYPDIPFEREHKFALEVGRQFRFDFAWPDSDGGKISLEIQGGIFTKGAHSTGTGLTRDFIKGNLAAALGWRCFQFSSAMARDPKQLEQLARTLRGQSPQKDNTPPSTR